MQAIRKNMERMEEHVVGADDQALQYMLTDLALIMWSVDNCFTMIMYSVIVRRIQLRSAIANNRILRKAN